MTQMGWLYKLGTKQIFLPALAIAVFFAGGYFFGQLAPLNTKADISSSTSLPISKGGTSADTAKDAILNLGIYPVGSIYISTTNTNPGDYLGGAWEAFGQGRTMVGIGNNGTTNYSAVNATGGLDSVAITANQMPSHSHPLTINNIAGSFSSSNAGTPDGNDQTAVLPWSGVGTYYRSYTQAFSAVGGNQAHENRMPYIVVYMWRRTL